MSARRFFFFHLPFLFKCVLWFFLFISFFLVFFFTHWMPPLFYSDIIVYASKFFNRATPKKDYMVSPPYPALAASVCSSSINPNISALVPARNALPFNPFAAIPLAYHPKNFLNCRTP